MAVAIPLLILLLVAGAAYGAARYALDNSYFIGADDSGTVTIYRGIPDEIAGLSLRETEVETNVSITDLPEFLRSSVNEGIKADSLEDARRKVEDLEERSRDADFGRPAGGGKDN